MSADRKDQAQPVAREESDWISRRDIPLIEGALKPAAYVARAYLVQRETGQYPGWARKGEDGNWLFDRAYIVSDGRKNQKTIGISEAADQVGTSRRTIQTWFDEGLLQASEEDRAAGESRQIDRDAFLKALPELKMRLGGAIVETVTPSIPPAQIDEDTLSKADRRSIAALRKRLAEARTRREAVLKEVRQAEKATSAQRTLSARMATRIEKLQKQFRERMQALEKTQSYVERKQAAELERVRHLSEKVQDMLAREAELSKVLDERIASSKRRQAEALSRRLESARRPAGFPGSSQGPALDRLRAASQRFGTDAGSEISPAHRQKAERIAEALMDEVDAGTRDRIDAAILFNSLAEQNHIPSDVRIAVTRDYFSRG